MVIDRQGLEIIKLAAEKFRMKLAWLSTMSYQPRPRELNWIIDSGATCHIGNDRSFFVDFKNLEKPLDITLGDGHVLKAEGCGTVTLMLQSAPVKRKCKLHEVLYVPDRAYNSVSGNLYYLPCVTSKDHIHVANTTMNSSDGVLKENLWHRRFCHLGSSNLQKLAKKSLFDFSPAREISFCEPCVKGKIHRNQFPAHSERITSEPLELVHSDVCRTIASKSLSGSEYFVTFTDDMTRYAWVYLKRKSEVFGIFKNWKAREQYNC